MANTNKPTNSYRVVTVKGSLIIGTVRFKEYNKALKHASKVAKEVPVCSVLLIKPCKDDLSLLAYFKNGKKCA